MRLKFSEMLTRNMRSCQDHSRAFLGPLKVHYDAVPHDSVNSSSFAYTFSLHFFEPFLIWLQIHADETKSSLQFASRALRVTNCVIVNEVLLWL